MNVLVVDIGGTNLKIWQPRQSTVTKVPTGKSFTPENLVDVIRQVTSGATIDRVSLGYPGEVIRGRPTADPYNLGPGWVDFDYLGAIDRPTRIMNDACMQAVGSYDGGRMLYLGLGTSVGTTFILDGKIVPLALGHLLFVAGESFERRLNRNGLRLHGRKRWEAAVGEAALQLKAAFFADYVVLGGGNAKKLETMPPGCRRGSNQNAYFGGLKMWEDAEFDETSPDIHHPDAALAMSTFPVARTSS